MTIKKKKNSIQKSCLYTLDVFISSGPMDEDFIEENPTILRTIEIRGDQTLEDLHDEIFDAFDREEEHMYEFQTGGKGPNDPDAMTFGLTEDCDGRASETTIQSLNLKVNDIVGYCFDFGDSWWHQIDVVSIKEKISKGSYYPQVVKSVGESPLQLFDSEDE